MKKIFLIICALLSALPAISQAQYTTRDTTSVNDNFAGTTFDTNYVTSASTSVRTVSRTVVIRNYGINTADTLVVWFDNDSTKLKVLIPPSGIWKGTMLLKAINTRCANGVIYRPFEVSQGNIELTANKVITTQSRSDSTMWILWDSTNFTRPANATAYTDGDIIRSLATTGGSLLGITAARTNGGAGYISSVEISHDTAYAAGINFDVIFYADSTGMGATLPADNAAYQSVYDFGKLASPPISLQTTSYGTTAGGATSTRGAATNINYPFRCIAGSTKLYAVIIARGAFTPKQSGKFRLKVFIQPTN